MLLDATLMLVLSVFCFHDYAGGPLLRFPEMSGEYSWDIERAVFKMSPSPRDHFYVPFLPVSPLFDSLV